MIIGITGFNASGKSTVAEYLEKKKNFKYFSGNKILSKECERRGLSNDRENLRRVANELRKELGDNALIIKAKELYDFNTENIVIESIRNVREINELRKEKDFYLLGMNANLEIRYKRAKERNRDKEVVSFEKFIESEKEELDSNNRNSQNLIETYMLIDFEIINDSDLKNLEEKVDIMLKTIQNINSPLKRFEECYVTIYKFGDKIIKRPFKHKYYLGIAREVGKRSTCLNVQYGAVIINNDQIISTGYVGAPREVNSSLEKGFCLRRKLGIPSGERYEICRSVHAEQNAIINSARAGVSLLNSTLYFFGLKYKEGDEMELIKGYPCFICKKMIINSGIKEFVSTDENGRIVIYNVKDWIKLWKSYDMLDDKIEYKVNYY